MHYLIDYIEEVIGKLINYYNRFSKKYPWYEDLYESVFIICYGLDGVSKLMKMYKDIKSIHCEIEPCYSRLYNLTKDEPGNNDQLDPIRRNYNIFWFNIMNRLTRITEEFEKDYIDLQDGIKDCTRQLNYDIILTNCKAICNALYKMIRLSRVCGFYEAKKIKKVNPLN